MPRPKRSRVPPTQVAKAPSPALEGVGIGAAPTQTIETTKESSEIKKTRASQLTDIHAEQAAALEDSRRRRDAAMNRLDDLTSTSTPGPANSPGLGHNARDETTARQPRLTDVSGLELDDDLFGNLDDSLDDTDHGIEETRTGYRSTDTSSFSVGMFRRRPRQSSVAGRDDAPIRPSSRGQNTPSISSTLNFGNFRRRAREPSILGTGRKRRTARSQSRASQTSRASRAASVANDGDESGPDGESTPLDRTRRQTRASLAANGSRENSPIPASRKRKSLESHEDGREKRPATGADSGVSEPEEIHQSIEIEVERSPSPPPRGRALERERPSTPAQEDDPDMAPPLSSSSEGDSPRVWPSMDTLAHRTYTRKPPTRSMKTPELRESSSELSSPPSLTHSPNYAAPSKAPPTKKKAVPPQKKVTTADLTSLLPRRRTKESNRSRNSNDPFDIDASEDERHDEEDVSYVNTRTAMRNKAQRPLAKSTSNGKGKAVETSATKGKKRSVRTYGAANEDKENDEVEDEIVVASGDEAAVDGGREESEETPTEETSQMMVERIGEELQKAAKKFKEVDKWQLSFEEAAPSSSPGPFAR
ncbi:hypothetical protein B0J18DRAFT_427620 [Chaetomium sp. MPI-SDFR-AT-0129]|nr:hypothetical protein B0J18DRAFT_427620 [Chaetomium sp. MPI-SDFR-AT-0129]